MTKSAEIFYAIDILPTDDIRRRLPRSRQSTAAFHLISRLEEKCPHPSATSKSHSRAVVAAAAGEVADLSLGIDVEWMAPNRPFEEITRMFMPSSSLRLTSEAFYRGWTFFEAYYKAFQHFPAEMAVRCVMAHRSESVLWLDHGTGVMQFCVADDFRACLVWRHGAGKTEISLL